MLSRVWLRQELSRRTGGTEAMDSHGDLQVARALVMTMRCTGSVLRVVCCPSATITNRFCPINPPFACLGAQAAGFGSKFRSHHPLPSLRISTSQPPIHSAPYLRPTC